MALSKIETASLDIGQLGGRRNLIINGAMQVAQRGTSSTAITGINVCDRWVVNGAAFSWDTTQNSLTSSDAPYQYGFRKSLKTENTSAGSASTSYQLIRHQIEAQNVAQSGWEYTNPNSYLVLSFWAKSSVAGTYHYHIRTEDGTSQMFIGSVTLASNVWKKVELSIPGNSNITVNNDNGTGLNLNWYVHLGTNYSGSISTETWTTYQGGFQTPDYTQDWGNTLGATFELTGVQLEVDHSGTGQASPFEHRSYGEELALCQRYFYTPLQDSRAQYQINFTQGSGSSGWTNFQVPFPVSMRVSPSLTHNIADSNRVTAAPNADEWCFYLQNQGYASKQGASNASVFNADTTLNYAIVGAYYVSPSSDASGIILGSGLTFEFSAEL